MPERLTPFAFEEQLVRCRLDEHGEPWFVAKDVAVALGYQWNREETPACGSSAVPPSSVPSPSPSPGA